jgi:hypothetical protein
MGDERWNLPADRYGMGDGTENRTIRTYILQFAIKKNLSIRCFWKEEVF